MSSKAVFLSNRPLGKDLLDGQSQDYVAQAIKKHIEEVDSEKDSQNVLPRIIGVEGSWGSGKSNMLLQLQNKLKAKYYFFTYDAWGNQEDLQRRSILEQLTDELIREEQLVKDTEITILDTDLDIEPTVKKCTWKRRLFALVARKSTTHDVTIPKMESSTKAFALMLLLVAIVPTVLDAMKPDAVPCWYPWVILGFTLLPFLIFMICKRAYKWSWNEMWKMYQTEGRTDSATYTISELEPSVSEFRKWMNDLADSLNDGKRLVIVFDNMDRLPREKVRQLWSSIQTFFAGKDYSKVWCIIPFDREHLANAFAEEESSDSNKLKLTNYFIEKTFPVVYRIPAPIITDYRGVFKELFEKAFGHRDEQDLINRSYRLKYPTPNMREMISFINKCVAQSHTWGDEIRLTSIVLFELNKDIIFNENKPDEVIINGGYIGDLGGVIDNDEMLPIEMSSLVYGVPKKKSAQLPLKNLTEKALASKDASDFNQYASEQPEFFVILDEVTGGMDAAYLDNAVMQISSINKENIAAENLKLLDKIWMRLGRVYLKRTQNETSFRDEVRLLVDNCPKQELKEKIAKKFIVLFATGEKNEHKGEEWFIVYQAFDAFTKENGINVQLPEKVLKAGDFLEYVLFAQEEYKNYPISCTNSEVNKTAISFIKEGSDISERIDLLKDDDRYDFSELLSAARDIIEEETATDENIGAVLNMCKALSDEPLKLNVNLAYLDTFIHESGVTFDLLLLRALAGKEISGEEASYYAEMARIAYYYTDTYEIWKNTHAYGTQVMAKVLGNLIKDNRHQGKPDQIKDVLTDMANIESRTGIDRQLLVRFVNDWGKQTLNDVEKKVVLPNVFGNENWCKALLEEKCLLSDSMLEKYYQDFNSQPLTSFVNANNAWVAQNTSYWLRVLKILVESVEFKSACSKKLIEITTHVIEGICTGHITDGNGNMDLQLKLLSWVEFANVSSKVNEMMGKFGNGQLSINVFKFKALHHYLEKTRGYETQYLNDILKPVIGNADVQGIILGNKDFYEQLLHDNMDQASDLKAELIKLHDSSKNEEFKTMVERLEILPKEEASEDPVETDENKK